MVGVGIVGCGFSVRRFFRRGGGCAAVLAGLVAEAWSDFERTAEKGGINVELISVFNRHFRRTILCRSFGGQVVRNKRMGAKK